MPDAVSLLNITAAAFGIWWAWYMGLRPHLSERFNFRLKQICEEIDEAEADPNVPTDNTDFVVLRDFAEGVRENSDHITALDLLVSVLLSGFNSSPEAEELMARINKLVAGDRGEKLESLAKQLVGGTGLYLIARSPSLWLPTIAVLLYQMIRAVSGLSLTVLKLAVVRVGLGIVRAITERPHIGGTFFRVRGRL
ncbi:hypothetical protein GGQ03_002356 [Salinibacter ruber]|uniref:hypothetical protein n=1 Tax=Salinibacter ruber TaxID=146919 RepID=UPI0021688F06|nr:hypothetical protein [Salinibacter ruber]MCS4155062.1 hypothetical protein [Salinibacter ruber]